MCLKKAQKSQSFSWEQEQTNNSPRQKLSSECKLEPTVSVDSSLWFLTLYLFDRLYFLQLHHKGDVISLLVPLP